MRLINADTLLADIDAALSAAGYDKQIPQIVADSFKALVNRQPEIKIPAERSADQCDVPSGYWFDKGWDACREEILSNA